MNNTFKRIVSKLDKKQNKEYSLNFDNPLAVAPANADNKLASI